MGLGFGFAFGFRVRVSATDVEHPRYVKRRLGLGFRFRFEIRIRIRYRQAGSFAGIEEGLHRFCRRHFVLPPGSQVLQQHATHEGGPGPEPAIDIPRISKAKPNPKSFP